MLSSSNAPMLGALTSRDYPLRSARGFAKARPWVQAERRSVKKADEFWSVEEQLGDLLDDEAAIAGDLFEDEDRFFEGDVDHLYVDDDLDLVDAYFNFLGGCPDGPDCDYEGCEVGAENIARRHAEDFLARQDAAAMVARNARHHLDDEDLPGWGTALGWDDLHNWRFSERPF